MTHYVSATIHITLKVVHRVKSLANVQCRHKYRTITLRKMFNNCLNNRKYSFVASNIFFENQIAVDQQLKHHHKYEARPFQKLWK